VPFSSGKIEVKQNKSMSRTESVEILESDLNRLIVAM